MKGPQEAGRRLAELLRALGLQQRDLAAEMGIDRSTVSRWVRGLVPPESPYDMALEVMSRGTPWEIPVALWLTEEQEAERRTIIETAARIGASFRRAAA